MAVADLATRLGEILEQRRLGSEAQRVADNVVRHEGMRPAHAENVVFDVLAHPARGIDAAGFFSRSVPAALERLVQSANKVSDTPPTADPVPIAEFLEGYLRELAEAQRLLVAARVPEGGTVLSGLGSELPNIAALHRFGADIDLRMLANARDRFLDANARLIASLRTSAGSLRFPDRPLRFDSPVGVVSIGTYGDDVHPADAAVIVDPGGNDVYQRAPLVGGAVSVIIDLGGDDRYVGADPVVGGLAAIIDFSGNDHYESEGAGVAAAIGGVSVIFDLAGNDDYRAGNFGLGAAAFGLGVLVDLAGNDRYRIAADGQGFGMAAGLGLLWDRAGNDRYVAVGPSDVWGRGGAISMAQGAAYGGRTFLGGGIGILRDDAGDDVYEAEMFAQGVGYYYGAGMLWDRGGDDRYRAVRYAQGAGVHEAYGLLRDESGDDRYELTWGVGQGMGLDLAVGVLYDGDGDDDYRASAIAQGAATANGIGIAVDLAGRNGWSLAPGRHGWGRAEWTRALPTLGFLIFEPGYSSFERGGEIVVAGAEAAKLGGPEGGTARATEPPSEPPCTPLDPAVLNAAAQNAEPATELLPALMPGIVRGTADPARYAAVRSQLLRNLPGVLATLPRDDFDVAYPLGIVLRCALTEASTGEAEHWWRGISEALAVDPATPFAGALASALRARPALAIPLRGILERLDAHPRCGVRSLSLLLRAENSPDAEARAELEQVARRALDSTCWREQAQALGALRRHGLVPPADTRRPAFLN